MATAATQVTDELKSTGKVSYFRIFLATLIFGPVYVIGTIVAARYFLKPDDVEWIRNSVSAAFGIALTGSGGATIYGGLAKTLAKIALQKAVATQSLPVQEVGDEVIENIFDRLKKRGDTSESAQGDEGTPDEEQSLDNASAPTANSFDMQALARAAANEAVAQFTEKYVKKAAS